MKIQFPCFRKSTFARCYHLKQKLAITLGLVVALLLVPSKTSAQTAWTGTWGAAPQSGGSTFSNQTIRQIVYTSVTGSTARIRLSNLFGTQPVLISDVHIALAGTGSSIKPGTDHVVTFGGSGSVTLAAGAEASSDSIAMTIPSLTELAISFYLPNSTSVQTSQQFSFQNNYIASGDVSGSTNLSVTSTQNVYFLLTNLDVQSPTLTGAVVTLGASITDGYNSTYNANHRWPNFLAQRLLAAGINVGVINEGISGNQLLNNGSGLSALNRFQHDAVGQPNVKWVIFSDDPINDVGNNSSITGAQLIAGVKQLISEAHSNGLKFLGSTLTPFHGATYWTSAGEAAREQYNAFVLSASSGCDGVIDQDTATHDPSNPTQFLPAYDSGDHLHPNDAGYQAIANAVNLSFFGTQTEAPFGGTPAAIPGTIQNENYDTGGQGVGYNVTSIYGTANSYRSDGVDLETTLDTGGGYDLGWASSGQWFKYTVNVATAGSYTVSFRVASLTAVGSNAGSFHLQTPSGTNLSGAINVPGTGGWQTWTTITANVTLPAGQQVIELFQDGGSYNVNYMTFTSSGGQVIAPVISSASTAFGTIGAAFSYQIAASNSPISYAATGLPAGLSMDASTGLISGTPTAAGTSSVTLSATNAGGTGTQTLTLKVANAWDLVGAADFNGDGKPDLIWQNMVTGQCALWLMNGTTQVGSVDLGTVSTDWEIVGAADFNKNGNSDLILQNTVTGERTIWLMNGTTHVSTVSIATIPTEWDLVGAADFNGDGNCDLIWQDNVTGERAFWLMNGTTPVSSLSLATIPTEWDLVGAADFNGDGKPDLLWQDTATGQRAIWLMNGTTAVSSVSLGMVATNWNLVGAADFNKNGNSDLIWQDTESNQCAIWLMNGTTYVSSVSFTFGLLQVTKPSFNPAGGTYTGAQSVTISDATSGVSIRYTTDGSTPSETNGTVYSGPVNIGSTTTLQAIAYANGYTDSPIASGTYTIGPPPTTVAIRALANNQYVTATDATTSLIANASTSGGPAQQFDVVNLGNGSIALRAHSNNLYVTADNAGASPLIANRTAAGPWETFQEVTVSGGVALKAQANGMYVSADNAGASPLIANRTAAGPWETFVFETPGSSSPAAAPTFSPVGGSYTSAQSVTITTTTSGATIRYTTDGSTPSETNGTVYSGPVNISTTTTLNAIVYESGWSDSNVTSANYAFGPSAGTHSFDTGAGVLNVDYASYLSKHDVVYNSPNTNPLSGLTVGNGRVGAMVWNANGLTMQVSGVDTSQQTQFGAGLVKFYTNPGMDTGYSTYQQRLSLGNGLLTTTYDSNRTVTIMGSPNSEVFGIHVVDARPGVSSVTVDLNMWLPLTWGAVSTYADATGAGLSRGQTDPNNFGYTLAASVEGTAFTTQAVDAQTVRLNITPASNYTIWIACASRLNAPGHDSVAQAKSLLAGIKSAGYTSTLANYTNFWANFWRKSFVQYSDASGSNADYLENFYYLATYMIASGGYGNYPFHFINGVYRATQDATKWSNAYWFWNQRTVYNSFLASNHPDLLDGLSNLYNRNFANLKAFTMTRFGIDGLWVPETMRWDGDAGSNDGSLFTKDIYSTGAEVAINMYLRYRYTQDPAYLSNIAYPFLKEVAKFYSSKLSFDAGTGKYHMQVSNAHETYWDVPNAITDLAAVRSVFPMAIEAGTTLNLDSTLRAQWQNILNNLVAYPTDGTNYLPHDPPATQTKNNENVACEMIWPYNITGIGAADYQTAVNTWNSRPFPYGNIWANDAVQAARLGLGDAAYNGMKTMLNKYQAYPNGMTDNTNGVFEYIGLHLTAMNESLLQSYNGKIRVFPAIPNNAAFINKFTLLAKDGFLVSSERENNEVKYIGIKSLYGQTAVVVNPWGTQTVQVRRASDNIILLTSSGGELSFSTAPNTVYIVERTAKPLGSYTYGQITGVANQGAKVLEGTRCSLGSFPPGYVPPPSGLAATTVSTSEVDLSWTASSGAASYNVKRATVSGGPYATIATGITATNYSDMGLANGTTYYYVFSVVTASGESANSLQAIGRPTGTLTNRAKGGAAAASAENPPNETAAMAFDSSTTTKWFNANQGSTGWLQYNFGPGITWAVTRYDLSSANDVPGRDPRDWQFQGSQDGTNWSTLDTQTLQIFPSRYQTKQYTINNTTAYQYYRLNIIGNNGDTSGVQLSELGLYSK